MTLTDWILFLGYCAIIAYGWSSTGNRQFNRVRLSLIERQEISRSVPHRHVSKRDMKRYDS